MEKCFSQIVQNYGEFNDRSRYYYAQALNSFTDHLIKTYGVNLVTAAKDSIVIFVECLTLKGFEYLWNDHLAGHLDKIAFGYLVTDEMNEELNLETINLPEDNQLEEDNYLSCKRVHDIEIIKKCLGE